MWTQTPAQQRLSYAPSSVPDLCLGSSWRCLRAARMAVPQWGRRCQCLQRGWICLLSGLLWSLEGLGCPPGSGMHLISWSLCEPLLTTTLRKPGFSACPLGTPHLAGIWAVSQERVRGTGSAAPQIEVTTPQGAWMVQALAGC